MVKRILRFSLIALVWLLIVATPAYAVSVTNALYIADLVVVNAGDATTNVSTVCDINTQSLIDGKYATEDLLNTAIQAPGGTDIAYMPGVGDSDPWVFFVPSIGTSESKSYMFFAGGPAMQEGFMYFPDSGGMVTDDDASLELGNNFQIEQSVYVDTSAGADKDLVLKAGAFKLYISEGDIQASILSITPTDETLRPDGAGDETNITSVIGAATHWEAVSDESDASYVYTTSAGYLRDLYTCEDSSSAGDINSVTIFFRIRSSLQPYAAYGQPVFKIGGNIYTGTEQHQGYSYFDDKSQVYSTSPATGMAWAWSEINGMQIGLNLRADGSHTAYCSEVWIDVNYDKEDEEPAVAVTAEDISGGEHIVKVPADGTDLKIYVDDELKDSAALGGASVIDNTNDWSFLTNGSALYMEYHKIWVGGTLVQHIVYERDTTFDDLTEYNNDATPTFRTTSSDSDVSATFQNFSPISENECTAGGAEETPELLGGAAEMPKEFYGAEGGGTGHLPGAGLINSMLDAGGIPQDLFWIMSVYGLAAVAALVSFRFLKSMLWPALISGMIILVFALITWGNPIPLWSFFIYAVIAAGLLVSERVFGW